MDETKRRVALLASQPPTPFLEDAIAQLQRSGFTVLIVTADPASWRDRCTCRIIAVPAGERLEHWIPPADWVFTFSPEAKDSHRYPPLAPRLPLPAEPAAILAALGTPLPPPPGPTLSVCMIVRDEEQNLPRALQSVAGVADEIVVVDTGSVDATRAVASSFGACLYRYAWSDDFAAARNASLEHAHGDWILVLDADEALSPEARRAIRRLLRRTRADALWGPLVNFDADGRVLRQDPAMRLFRNRPEYRFSGRIHEQVLHAIERAGGAIDAAPDLVLYHFGYTAAENQRKHRLERNCRLIERSLKSDPDSPLLWYYHGSSLLQLDRCAEALHWLQRSLAAAPQLLYAEYSRLHLAQCYLRLRQDAAVWHELASGPLRHLRSDRLVQAGSFACREGDFVLARHCAAALEQLPPAAHGNLSARAHGIVRFAALAAVESGDPDQALSLLQQRLQVEPGDAAAAVLWVDLQAERGGLRAATVEALRQVRSPAMAAAVLQYLVRTGDWDWAGSMAASRSSGAPSIAAVHALVRSGRQPNAITALSPDSLETATHLALLALELEQRQWWDRAVAGLTPARQRCLTEICTKTPPDPDLDWLRLELMQIAAAYRLDQVLAGLATRLAGGAPAGYGAAALALWQARRTADAVTLALQLPAAPGCQHVLGLHAYAAGDWEAAGTLLAQAAADEAVPVRVYWRGADALRRAGQESAAAALLELGRTRRPASPLLGGKLLVL